MIKEDKYIKTLQLRVDPEMLDHLKIEAENRGTDVSTYVRWCIHTGMFLEDLNNFVKSKKGEEK
jgi:predicted DNA-binding protein